MRAIDLYYADIQNMGDQLNLLLFRDYFHMKVKRSSYLTGECSAIGSGLDQYLFHGTKQMRRAQKWYGLIKPTVKVWGTGFINYPAKHAVKVEQQFFKKNMKFYAVRGEMSKKRIEGMLGKKLNIPTGDGGLLASELLEKLPEKRYEIGIIPHLCDRKEQRIQELKTHYEHAILIELTDEPYKVLRQIASCKTILSSSLHGLVVADSFGIPNIHAVVSEKPLGDGFKFDDYYSAFGVEHQAIDLRKEKSPTTDEIRMRYRITPEMVAKKKQELLDVFPYKRTVQMGKCKCERNEKFDEGK